MAPRYVIVVESSGSKRTADDLAFEDDLDAIVTARRVFVQELFLGGERPLAVTLGRQQEDGELAWLGAWRSPG